MLQVTPKELTDKLLAAAMSLKRPAGGGEMVKVLLDAVTSMGTAEEGEGNKRITGVQTHSSGFIEANNVVISLGPWSGASSSTTHYTAACLIGELCYVCIVSYQ